LIFEKTKDQNPESMALENLIAFFLLNYLRKNFDKPEPFPNTNRLLIIGMAVAAFLGLLGASDVGPRFLTSLLSLLLMGALIYGILTLPSFSKGRPIVAAILPYVSITFLAEFGQILFPSTYSGVEALFETAEFFAFIWAVAQWWISRRQRKALEIQRLIAEQKERELVLTEKIKAQLEIEVAERTADLTKQKEELEKALTDLKATQEQLILAEKMASLGELTAGIAHEIQNPLNFVNNFSELNHELLDELEQAAEKGDTDEIKEIIQDLKNNEEKIVSHGKRAEGIVKSMLQHSRKESGKKEPTDINKLADEYLRLSYHGLRAKDKSFNATYKTDFDPNLPQLEVVSQDIGRVLLNLINNAFYAVGGKEAKDAAQSRGEEYVPTVTVTTKKLPKKVEISVIDNGMGIPDEIKDKIFQPFFTTKPTGQGTGLGLSLSYDIVKGHGGELRLQSDRGKGTEFVISLPCI
jgi:two-component system, NtrC family, sensor kinase